MPHDSTTVAAKRCDPPRAALYVRVSTKGQEEDGSSLGTQQAACRQRMTDNGYQFVEAFSDTHTGTQYRERPALSRLRALVRSGGVDVVVCYALDRLSRNQAHLAILIEEFEEHGARVELVTEVFEDTAIGRFIRSAKGFAAEIEREKILERSERGRRARVDAGKLLPGQRPRYGYRWRDPQRTAYDPDPVTSLVVERMFREAFDAVSTRKIARNLTADGIPTATGNGSVWSHTTVRNILTDPIYTGRATAYRWESRKSAAGKLTNRRRPLDEQVVLPDGTVPALVDDATFDAVQRRMEINKHRLVRESPRKEEALLRGGYVRCAYCDAAMAPEAARNDILAYRCHRTMNTASACRGHSINTAILDNAVWSRVRRLLTDPTTIVAELRADEADDPTERDLSAIDASIADVQRRRTRLAQRIAGIDDDFIAEPLVVVLERDGELLRKLQEERAAVAEQQAMRALARRRIDDLSVWCGTVAGNIDELSWDQRRVILDVLDVRVRVRRPGDGARYQIAARVPLGAGEVDTSARPCVHLRLRWSSLDHSA